MALIYVVVKLGPRMTPNNERRVRARPRDNLDQDVFEDSHRIDIDWDDRRDEWIGGWRQCTGGIGHWSVVQRVLCVRVRTNDLAGLVIEGERARQTRRELLGCASYRMLGLATAYLRAHVINAMRPLLFSARTLPQRSVMPQVHVASLVELFLDLPSAGAVAPIVAMNRNARIPRKVCPAQLPRCRAWETAPLSSQPNHGKRPCSHVRRKRKIRDRGGENPAMPLRQRKGCDF